MNFRMKFLSINSTELKRFLGSKYFKNNIGILKTLNRKKVRLVTLNNKFFCLMLARLWLLRNNDLFQYH